MNEVIKGIVVHGKGNGKKFLIPTFNLDYKEKTKIDLGVYISKVILNENEYFGITNIGKRPTVDDEEKITIETYIIDFDKDIYGEEVTLIIKDKLRETKRFENLKLLKEQLEKDILNAKERSRKYD